MSTNETTPEDLAEDKNEEISAQLVEREQIHQIQEVKHLFENWFLDYASYVILDRSVPSIEDGLKPVQRRILHAMREMDDGRFNKVANVIGQTMQYHPHGDVSIGDAMVNIGQKDLLIETQGNWGDVRTGDRAAASRYIEARLSKFALEVAFNPQTTEWQLSYDGRKREPVNLPMKFPLLLAQGVEGIAVGLSTIVMPHNFKELIDASIAYLKGESFQLYPDFLTSGLVDVNQYNDGKRGGKIKVRSRIEERDKKLLVIKDVPYGVDTNKLIESIIKANDAGKIKIKKVVDSTAAEVEIEIHLHPGISPDITIDALYAFTDCQKSISPNACIIIADKPHFLNVSEILRQSTDATKELLRRELSIRRGELDEKWHFSSLEKVFIENRIYRDIEECETWEAVIETIDKGLEPYRKLFRRVITTDDIIRLTEIKIKRISKFDSFKADELINSIEAEMKQVDINLEHLVIYAIDYFKNLLKKYGKGRERKTEIRTFDNINANIVAIANQKLYVNREEGFAGVGLKKDEYVSECSSLDDIIVFKNDGKYLISKVQEKSFFGKGIMHIAVWKKGDDRMVYHAIYYDAKSKATRVKRFTVSGVVKDKEYDLTTGVAGCKVLHFSANPNSEGETVLIQLSPNTKAKNKLIEYDFANLEIKGRSTQGNLVTRHLVKKVVSKSKGASTKGGREIWYDSAVGRLNVNQHGKLLGSFNQDDLILVIFNNGFYELTNFELTNRYEPDQILILEKFIPGIVISAIHFDPKNKQNYAKRFTIETTTIGKKFSFISEEKQAKLWYATSLQYPQVKVYSGLNRKASVNQLIDLQTFADVRGWKAMGTKITDATIWEVEQLDIDNEKETEAITELSKELIIEASQTVSTVAESEFDDLEQTDKSVKQEKLF